MNLESALREIARTLVDAFDVDIQLWMGRAFVRLRETELGASFADWAEANTIVFESLLRVTSAMVRRLPQDSNLVIETIYTQLSRLPVEVKRAVEGEVPRFVMRSGGDKDQFRQRFEEAVTSLSDDDLAKVVRLKSHQLQEWVNSPSKIRPHLLTKWAEQESERRERSENTRAVLRDSAASVPAQIDTAAEKLATHVGKAADWLEAHGGKSTEKRGLFSRKRK